MAGRSLQRRAARSRRAGVLAVALVVSGLTGVIPTTPWDGGSAAAADVCGNVTNVAPRIVPDRTTIGSTETATVTVTGSGYLLPTHVCGTDVFGGVYLVFGWVRPGGQWGPSWRTSTSSAGLFGQTYSYPGEGGGAETRDDGTGAVRLISFTAGGESGTSTEFHMDAAGNWRSTLIVRGSTYSYLDLATGTTATVDCLLVQCGVFTIGAHGKSSRTNEQFSPIDFTSPTGAAVVPPAAASAAPGGATGNEGAAANGGGANGPSGGGVATGGTLAPAVPGGAGDGSAVDTTTSAPGSVGEAPVAVQGESTVPGGTDGAASDEADTARAKVQDFGGSTSGSDGSAVAVVGGIVGAVALAAGGAFVVRRRRTATTGGAM